MVLVIVHEGEVVPRLKRICNSLGWSISISARAGDVTAVKEHLAQFLVLIDEVVAVLVLGVALHEIFLLYIQGVKIIYPSIPRMHEYHILLWF